jgi:hypothetical protein
VRLTACRAPLLALAALLAACASPTGSGKSPSGSDTGLPTGDTGGPGEDEALLRAAIAGEVDAAEALATIADRGGLPVPTAAGTHLFACTCGPGDWAVAGDHDGWAGAPMAAAGELRWVELTVPEPVGSRYKFVGGGGASGAPTWMADPLGRRHAYDENGRISLVAAEAAHLQAWYGVSGGGLRARDVEVFVPAGGAFTHALYAHDGQNLFDPAAIWGGWRLQEALPEGVLVIGVHNTPDRMDEYTHVPDRIDGVELGGRADAYAELVDGLRSRMEEEYGVPRMSGLMGSSLGGLVSLVIAELQPGRWDMALSLSGTAGWGSIGVDGETVLDRYADLGPGGAAIYVDSGGGGPCEDRDGDGLQDDHPDSADNFCENRQLADQLAAQGYQWEVDLYHWHEAGAPHNEQAWAARVSRPLALFAAR